MPYAFVATNDASIPGTQETSLRFLSSEDVYTERRLPHTYVLDPFYHDLRRCQAQIAEVMGFFPAPRSWMLFTPLRDRPAWR